MPLDKAIERLNELPGDVVLLDRRIDPAQRVTLSVDEAAQPEIVRRLAASMSLGVAEIGGLMYLAPVDVARRLPAVIAARRKELEGLPEPARRSLVRRRELSWPRLTEPRSLIARVAQERGWRVEGIEQVDHDLWPAGHLPALPTSDQLTLLLAEFDRTFQLQPDQRVIELVALDWSRFKPVQPTSAASGRSSTPRPSGKQVFSLRVEEQPLIAVLEALTQQLGWQLVVDEKELRQAGRSLDRRVSFSVQEADIEQLLAAILDPAGLDYTLDGTRLRIQPDSGP